MSSHREHAHSGAVGRIIPSWPSRRERWLWVAAIGLWLVGDLVLVVIGARNGITAWTPGSVAMANKFGLEMFSFLLLGKTLVLGVAGLSYSVLKWEFRDLIPMAIIAVGLLALGRNLAIIRLVI